MTALDTFEAKLDALRSWHRTSESGHPTAHGYVADGPLDESRICRIEKQFGVVLPIEYRAFLNRFGDGRVGPGILFHLVEESLTSASRQPFPLTRALLGRCSPEHNRLSEADYGRLLKEWEAAPKDHGVLQISDYGCAIYGVLILNGPFCGKVWILQGDTAYYGPFGGAEALHDEYAPVEWVPTDSPKDYSFFEWYDNWLDGELKKRG